MGRVLMGKTDILSTIFERTSIRHFVKGKRISEANLRKILVAGISAPSAGNIQPRTLIVVKDETVKERLYQLCENQAFMKEAPAWIVACVDIHRHLKAVKMFGVEYDYTGILPYTLSVLDTALSLENMVVAAEALGLGSVMIGSIIEHPEKAREILELPEHCLALCILCIGYPKTKPEPRKKWDYNVIVSEDRYRNIEARDVSKYWKGAILNNLKRGGKKISPEIVARICKERNYGESYANHYKEEFVKTTNRKLSEFLRKQRLVKD